LIPVRILGTGTHFPGRLVTTEEIAARAVPPLDPKVVRQKTGIASRWFGEPGTMIADIAAQALRRAAEAAKIDVRDLRRVILVNSEGGDILGPATVNATIHQLGLDGRCDGFDMGNACMGFLTGLDLGARSVATGLHPVGVVAAEVLTRAIRPDHPRPWVVFGDGAAAAILGPGRPGEGLLGTWMRNDGSFSKTVYAEHPLITRQDEWLRMAVPHWEMGEIVVKVLREAANAVLAQCGETFASVDWVLPHQPNGAMLGTIVDVLGIDPAKIVNVVEDLGSIVAASVPASLDRLVRTRPVKPGDRVLMIGVGSGVTYGASLYRFSPEGPVTLGGDPPNPPAQPVSPS
jgi:3-oxoacyl-(acyl-carrier-protein) synthase III